MGEATWPEGYLEAMPMPNVAIAQALCALVRRTLPEATERFLPGWRVLGYDVPAGRRRALAVWIMVEPAHVHLGFRQGALMADPDRRLETSRGVKLARWLTFRPGDDLDESILAPLIVEGARVAGLSRQERFARLLDGGPLAV